MTKENSTPIEKLFGSKTRAKLLQLFFANPTKSFYIREMTRVIDEQIHSVRRELSNLETIGVVRNESYDNKLYYAANSKHPFYRPLVEMFSKKVEFSDEKEVAKNDWEDYCRPVQSYLSGLIVTNRIPGQDGLDLLIIGDDRTKKLTRWAEVVEKKQGKNINYSIMSPEDFTYRRSVRDRFLEDILDMEITEVIDYDGSLKGITKTRIKRP